MTLALELLPGEYAVCRCPAGESLPDWVPRSGFVSVTHTPAELSIVCDARAVPAGALCQRPWRMFAVRGPLDFALTGVLASLTSPLAVAGVSVFCIATYDTDYLLVGAEDVHRALEALGGAGHQVVARA